MKVLHVISSGGMYGAEAVILNLMRGINLPSADACALAVFSQPGQPAPALYEAALRAGFGSRQVHLLECRGQLDRGVGRQLRALVAQGTRVVHAHGYKADLYCAYAWGRSRPALVSTCHTWYDNDLALRVYGALDRWVLRRFDGVVSVSADVHQRLLGARVPAERIRLIRNGVSMSPFLAAGVQRNQRSGSSEPFRIGLVGRLAPEKGIDLFLRAAALLLKEHPQLSFEVAGEGPQRAALENLRHELGLEKHVRLGGSQTDMPAFYASLNLLVSASRQEGLPVALLEGMASGLPVVATQVGAVPEIVIEGVTGLIVPPESPEALAAAIVSLLSSPALRASLGQAAQERVAAEFSASRMSADYLAVYQQALARHTGADASSQEQRA